MQDKKKPDRGAMGFPERWCDLEETRRRQRASGRWTASNRAKATTDLRAQALALHGIGKTERQIAAELGVSPATAHRWIKSALKAY